MTASKSRKIVSRDMIILLAILVFKIVLMGLFSSDYQQKMFEPFVSQWLDGLSNGVLNPYQAYYDMGQSFDFPYPAGMLFIMSVGGAVNKLIPNAPLFIHNIVFKLPLLIFDFLGYVFLRKMFPGKSTLNFCIYLLSPIILYSVFMHGQLDIIPMVLLLISLYYISGNSSRMSFFLSALFLALSLTTKLHIVAVVPLVLIYIYKKYGCLRSLIYTLMVCIMSCPVLILFNGSGFITGVLFNHELSSAFMVTFQFGKLSLYLSLFAIGIIYLYILNLNIISKDLLFTLSGMIFAVFLAICVPMPAWYVWVVPFITVFMMNANQRTDTLMVYILLQAAYILYFVFFHSKDNVCDLYFLEHGCDFLKIHNPLLVNISFTVLTCVLVWTIYIMQKFGIKSLGIYRFHDKNFVIGISGDSGVGKSTLQQTLSDIIPQRHLLVIEGDGDHKWERGNKNWNEYTHLNPKANYLYRQAQDISKLKNGESVYRVSYDHSTGQFTKSHITMPKKFISISGLHTFYLPQLRNCLDLKIYIEADEELRCLWKIARDSSARGQSEDSVRKSIEARYEDSQKFILPQKDCADMIIHYILEDKEPLRIGMKIYIDTRVDIEDIIAALHDAGTDIVYYFSDDFRYQIAEYHPAKDGSQPEVDFEALFYSSIEMNTEFLSIDFSKGSIPDKILELIIMRAICEKMRSS